MAADSSIRMWFWRAIIDLFKIPAAFSVLKADPEKRKTSQAIGLRGLIWLLVGLLIMPLTIWAFKGAIQMFEAGQIIGGILVIILAITMAIYGVIIAFLNGLLCSIFQLILNRKPLGWIDLILLIGFVVEVVLVITHYANA
ncbi:MAG: hypothetical protein IJS68_02565 [Clostridia bacterium]|nr:hypothetical protein [Clostridia bacterium]